MSLEAINIVPVKIMFVVADNMQSQKGFTLIELILYVGISSFILLVTFLFASQILEARVKAQAIAEVEQQGDWVVQTITQAIKNSKSPINSPTINGTASLLSLTMADTAKNPTDFSLSNGAIIIGEANGVALSLTNSNVVVSGLSFQNLSRTGTAGNIKFSFVVSYNNQGQLRYEFNYSKTFYGSSSVRY